MNELAHRKTCDLEGRSELMKSEEETCIWGKQVNRVWSYKDNLSQILYVSLLPNNHEMSNFTLT